MEKFNDLSNEIVSSKFDEFSGLKILFVDDIEDNIDLIKQIFTKYPFSIDFAINGKEAVEKVSNNNYSMIFMDLTINRILGEIKNRRNQIESALSLGINPVTILKDFKIIPISIENGITPTINNLKTLGLVFISGLMSGMIIAGISPINAAFYKIIIFFLLLLAGLLASIFSSYFIVNKIFDKDSESIKIQ